MAGALSAVFFLLGVGSSLPWNVFITAQDYFEKRLADTVYAESFLNWFSMAFNISTLLSMLVRTVVIGDRMPGAIATVFCALFVIMSIMFMHCLLTRMPEFEGDEFFRLTMVSILFVSCASTMMQDGLLRIVAKFPPRCTQGLVAGQAMAGLAVSISNFAILYANADEQADGRLHFLRVLAGNADLCAFLYFVLVFLTLIGCVVMFVLLTRMEMFRYYQNADPVPISGSEAEEAKHFNTMDTWDTESRETLLSSADELEHGHGDHERKQHVDLVDLAYRLRFYAATPFFVFIITLAVFPGITSAIKSVTPARGRFYRELFTPSSLILFNLGDFVSRLCASWWTTTSDWRVMSASLARIAFVPLLMVCNLQNEHHQVITYVLFHSDLFPLVLVVGFAFTNGLLCTLALMHYPRLLRSREEKELGGTVMFFILSVGLTVGSLMSFVLRAMLKP